MRVLLALALPLLVAAAPTPVTVTVHVAAGAEADDAWIAAEIQTATERLGAAGVEFSAAPAEARDVPAEVTTVAQRDDLAALAPRDGTIHLFVVRKLADKDAPGWINGVTWRHRDRRYLVIAHADALPDTLAHELGHFFGLSHTTAPENLMTAPGRRDGATLDPRQIAIVRRRITKSCWSRSLPRVSAARKSRSACR